MTKIYTKSGDRGETGLIGGERVQKDHPFIKAVGEVDELNAQLGVALCGIQTLSFIDRHFLCEALVQLQNLLFEVGAELACGDEVDVNIWVTCIESKIDDIEKALPTLKNFILPGGHPVAAQLHLTRAVCRRLERTLVEIEAGPLVSLINRLSDYLFVLARFVNVLSYTVEEKWMFLDDVSDDN